MRSTISIQVPEGAEPGDTLSFLIDGNSLEIQVPLGSVVGDVLNLQVASDENAANDDDDGDNDDVNAKSSATKERNISLVSGKTLCLCNAIEETVEEEEHHTAESDGTNAMAWSAGLRMVEFLDKSPKSQEILSKGDCATVLELGSGIGYAGIAFGSLASHHRSKEESIQVILTDVPRAMSTLKHSIKHNQHLCDGNLQIRCAPLQWNSRSLDSSFPPVIDWIVASDVLYNCASIPDLTAIILKLLSASTRILVAVRWRKPDLERAFFERLSDKISWELVDGDCPLSWREYGNPDCVASNTFFTQTSVAVAGKSTPLSEMDETASSKMRDEEYEAWERLQVQIYMGTSSEPRSNKRLKVL